MGALGPLRLLRLRGVPVLEMLHIEEALYRVKDAGNWMVVNEPPSRRTIVLGISGKVAELVDAQAALADGAACVKRFTGGGTVVADGSTVMTSVITGPGGSPLPGRDAFPGPVMEWSARLFEPVFADSRGPGGASVAFGLTETDYTVSVGAGSDQDGGGARRLKIGGNAQAISQGRFVHHTSWLWDFDDASMALLLEPRKRPNYRGKRTHLDFLTRIRRFMPDRKDFVARLCAAPAAHGWTVTEATESDVARILDRPHLRTSREVDLRAAASPPAPGGR
ncbi:unnamed protein product [Pedinophyceae sp. YPF-701]|nr:unnamed protein product [Pedinophyceae sp. YPF-701]